MVSQCAMAKQFRTSIFSYLIPVGILPVEAGETCHILIIDLSLGKI